MIVTYSVFIFMIGICLGSFYNVVGTRLPKGESIIQPSSHCEKCQHQLAAWELIPVLSYFIVRGRCRKCKTKFGAFHPIMEFLTGALFVAAYIHFGFTIEMVIAWMFISLLVIITVSDICYMIIQDKILLIFGTIILILRIIAPIHHTWWDAFAGAALGFGLLLLIALVSKGGMGGGDIKLYAVIGLVLGFKLTFISLFLASFIGLIAAIIGRVGRGKPIPFGPSIAAGSLISYFYGDALFEWYMLLFS